MDFRLLGPLKSSATAGPRLRLGRGGNGRCWGLRQVLGRNGRLEAHGRAYRLDVGPGERDVDRFEELVARGRAHSQSDPERAAEALRQALGLWDGSADQYVTTRSRDR